MSWGKLYKYRFLLPVGLSTDRNQIYLARSFQAQPESRATSVADPGCLSRIPDPDFLPIPDQGPGGQKHRIPDPQHCEQHNLSGGVLPGGGRGNKAETLVAAPLPLLLLLLLLLPLLHGVLAGLTGPLLPSFHTLTERSKGYVTYLSNLRCVRFTICNVLVDSDITVFDHGVET
jgi:hypothetical protein